MWKAIALISAGILLSACAPSRDLSPTPNPDACGASRLQGLVGQRLDAFDPAAHPGPVRVIAPNMAVTMDYSEERLNVSHNRRLIITSVACG